jgi:F-type H+-transporting ATPase subunit b
MNINATLISQAIIFAVFVYICYKNVWPSILSIMEEREKKISDGVEASKKADDALEEAQIAFNKEMEKAKLEASEILEKASNRASQMVGDAKEKAEKEAEKILTSASKSVENEISKAKEDLRQQLSDIIIDASQKILNEEVSKEKHDAVLRRAAEEL